MRRLIIQLTEEQMRKIKELGVKDNVSMSALIRKAIDHFLVSGADRKTLYRRAMSVVGKYKAKETDIAARHDAYLEKDFKK